MTTTIRTTAASTETFTRTHAYDGNGRPSARLAAHAAHAPVEKTRAGPALEVRTSATSSAPVFEYVHADHLGSAAAVTDASGAALLSLAHDPYGTRRRADWTGQLPAAEVAALAAGQDAGRARSAFTGHEPLDRTGFVHMNGRLYDPRVGRFMSPDPVVSRPWSGQGWNPYSYVQNSPLSFTDPTGYIMEGGCIVDPSGGGAAAGALGGFTSVAATLWTRGLSFRIPIYFTVQWRSVSFSVGGSLGVDGWGDDRSYAGVSYRPWVTVAFGPVTRVWTALWRWISLGQEQAPADDREPVAHFPKRAQTTTQTDEDGSHYYRIRGIRDRYIPTIRERQSDVAPETTSSTNIASSLSMVFPLTLRVDVDVGGELLAVDARPVAGAGAAGAEGIGAFAVGLGVAGVGADGERPAPREREAAVAGRGAGGRQRRASGAQPPVDEGALRSAKRTAAGTRKR